MPSRITKQLRGPYPWLDSAVPSCPILFVCRDQQTLSSQQLYPAQRHGPLFQHPYQKTTSYKAHAEEVQQPLRNLTLPLLPRRGPASLLPCLVHTSAAAAAPVVMRPPNSPRYTTSNLSRHHRCRSHHHLPTSMHHTPHPLNGPRMHSSPV